MCDAHVVHQGGRDKALLHQLLLPIGLELSHPRAWEPSNSWRTSTLQQRKRNNEEHSPGLRVVPMTLLETFTDLVTTGVTGIRNKAQMTLGYEQGSPRDNLKRLKCSQSRLPRMNFFSDRHTFSTLFKFMPLDDGDLGTSWLLLKNKHLKAFFQGLYPSVTNLSLLHRFQIGGYYGWQFQLPPSETWLLSAMAVTRSTWFMPGLSQWRKFPFLGRQLFPLPTALLEKWSDFQLNRVDWTHINQYAFHQTAQVSFDYTKSETGGVNIVPGWDCRCTLLSTKSEYQLVLILSFSRGMEKNEFAR